MTLRALAFTLTTIHDGRRIGHAVICPEVRYASVRDAGSGTIVRRHVADWRPIEAAVAGTFSTAPLESDHPIAQLVAGSEAKSWRVAFLTSIDREVTSPFDTAPALDAFLTGLGR